MTSQMNQLVYIHAFSRITPCQSWVPLGPWEAHLVHMVTVNLGQTYLLFCKHLPQDTAQHT